MPDIFIDKETTETHASAEKHAAKSKESSNPSEKSSSHKNKETVKHLEESMENNDQTTLPENMDESVLLHNLGIKKHGGQVHAFSSYFENPSKIKFTNRLNEEIMVLFLRKHFVTNTPWILKAIAMALIPVLFELLSIFGFYSTGFIGNSGKFVVYFFYYFFIFSGYIFVNYMTWFYNISLVTNIRVVDIDFSDIVFENVAATKISQLEDVNYKQIGILRSIFDYGDVFVQTAGTNRNFEFLAVPHPENVIRIINSLLGRK